MALPNIDLSGQPISHYRALELAGLSWSSGSTWTVKSSGAIVYVKMTHQIGAVCEHFAASLAQKAGIPGPETGIIRYHDQENKPRFLCLSSALGQEQETLRKFLSIKPGEGPDPASPPDPTALLKVNQSISYLCPFVEFIRHYDFRDENVIVCRWMDGEKKFIGAYVIDYAMLDQTNRSMRALWANKNDNNIFLTCGDTLVIDQAMYELGVAAVKNITDADIRQAVETAYDLCSLQKSGYTDGFFSFPPSEVVIDKLRSSRQKIITNSKIEEIKSLGKNLLPRSKGARHSAPAPTPPPVIPLYARKVATPA